MNIYQKLIEVRKEVPYLQKADKGYQFNYTGSSRVLGSLKMKMDELGLLLIPKVLDKRVYMETIEYPDPKTNLPKKTTTYFTELDMEYTWVNAENPEEQITVPWYGQGIDTAGEKGVGKALTYAEKYFMLKFFNIATDKDDPDAFQKKFGDDETEHKTASMMAPSELRQKLSEQNQEPPKGTIQSQTVGDIKKLWLLLGYKVGDLNRQIKKSYEKEDICGMSEEDGQDFLGKLHETKRQIEQDPNNRVS